ncbi:hypothetical protein D3C87_1328410 [compost metagenome]
MQPQIVQLDDTGHQPVHADRHRNGNDGQHRHLAREIRARHRPEADDDDFGRQDEVGPNGALDLVAFKRNHVHRCVLQGLRARLVVALVRFAMRQEFVRQFLYAFVAEERAAQHQQRRHRPGRERADQ